MARGATIEHVLEVMKDRCERCGNAVYSHHQLSEKTLAGFAEAEIETTTCIAEDGTTYHLVLVGPNV